MERSRNMEEFPAVSCGMEVQAEQAEIFKAKNLNRNDLAVLLGHLCGSGDSCP